MRVTIKHREETRGMIKKAKLCVVDVSVQFTEEERQIIDMWELSGYVIMERDPPVGSESDNSRLSLYNVLHSTDAYVAGTPFGAKIYHEEVKASMETLKEFIMANAGIENKHETFEV
jgi:hypothetical protein